MLTYGLKREDFKDDAADLDIDRFREEWYRWASNGPNNGKTECGTKNQNFFFNGLLPKEASNRCDPFGTRTGVVSGQYSVPRPLTMTLSLKITLSEN